MTIYTYIVEHGDSPPRVGPKTDVNGGRLISVVFDDLMERFDELEAFIGKLRDTTTCDQTKYEIDDFTN